MEQQLERVKEILKKYNQEHLLQFWDELSDSQKEFLLNQILSINFDEAHKLYEQGKIDVLDSTTEIEPLPYMNKADFSQKELDFYSHIGKSVIMDGKIGVITLAGGQGSRLGFKGPKGTFELDTKPKISLFEIICNYLKVAISDFGII